MTYQANVTVNNYTPDTLPYGTYYWRIDSRQGAITTTGDDWSFTTAPTAGVGSLADAVDNFALTWTTGGDFNWLYQTATTNDGVDAAKSGSPNLNQESWLQTTVNGSGTISFWWNVDCEAHPLALWDRLEFYIDAVEKARIASTVAGVPLGWSAISFTIATGGAHTLKWRYFVDDPGISGQNCAWVDQVVWTGTTGPMITTNAATDITKTSATLNGAVNPNGFTSYGYFEYGQTISFAEGTTAVQSLGSGTNVLPITATISGLSPNTIYYFRLVVNNPTGTNNGGNQAFTTAPLSPPTIIAGSASDVDSISATLNATVNPNSLATSAYFEWGLDTGYGNTMASKDMGSGSAFIPISDTINGLLQPNNTYYYRLVATNIDGTSYGLSRTFTTAAVNAPLVNTGIATNISTISATLNGTVNPNGFSTNAYFQYGPSAESYGSPTDSQDVGAGSSYVPVSATINGLSESTTYHFRIVATNANGTTYGVNQTFTTIGYKGNGADGAVTINSLKNINVDAIAGARTVADGWCSRITSLTTNTATLTIAPPSGAFAAGDEVILISLKGTVSSTNIGNYEFLRVLSVAGAVITFHENKTKYYGETDSQDNNLDSTQFVLLQRVPNYTDVTVNWNATLTCDGWNGITGGVLAFRAIGTVAVGTAGGSPIANRTAYITASGKGHRGGTGVAYNANAPAGETYCGGLYPSGGVGGTGDGLATPNPGGGGGGGGGYLAEGATPPTFGSAGTEGPAGGGGGAALTVYGSYSSESSARGGGGGGGAYGSVGIELVVRFLLVITLFRVVVAAAPVALS
ncbi:MAG: hypothetical protein HY762_07255 [Planctomycetes bacterium]|nr:hypothetical protein [Planctomycetota bacterium]